MNWPEKVREMLSGGNASVVSAHNYGKTNALLDAINEAAAKTEADFTYKADNTLNLSRHMHVSLYELKNTPFTIVEPLIDTRVMNAGLIAKAFNDEERKSFIEAINFWGAAKQLIDSGSFKTPSVKALYRKHGPCKVTKGDYAPSVYAHLHLSKITPESRNASIIIKFAAELTKSIRSQDFYNLEVDLSKKTSEIMDMGRGTLILNGFSPANAVELAEFVFCSAVSYELYLANGYARSGV
jgi:hypothetical protein